MKYRVDIPKRVQKCLDRLPLRTALRLGEAIHSLRENPRPPGAIKLVNRGESWRVRVGDYRIIYEIQDRILVVLVVDVGHRREIYR